MTLDIKYPFLRTPYHSLEISGFDILVDTLAKYFICLYASICRLLQYYPHANHFLVIKYSTAVLFLKATLFQ